ncbi:MAG: cytochrome b N-terminal domain-containing protein, partial [Thermoguttaceae bacterium]|nr:cytochrome b N-terminal domain-containing protein [Thermoguttaceae bacterium]
MNFLKWLDERTGLCAGFQKVANWSVPAANCFCRFLPRTLIFLFLMQGITGLFLWAFYSASPTSAWESVYYIQYHLPGGWLVRGLHHYSAQLFVGLSGLYVLGLIVHGGCRRPREFVYWAALGMFLFSLGSCLTGDLLNWSLSGYFATITRVSFLQLLPVIGVPLYQLVVGGPDPQFGALTLTRFLVLHIAVFGGGGLALMAFWKWADYRSRALFAKEERFDEVEHKCALACANKKRRAFWGSEALFTGVACLVVFGAALLLVFQHSLTSGQIAERAATLPAEAYLGAGLTSPVDTAGSYDAARPEWSFRALYHMSKLPIFSKIGMIYAIFVVPPAILLFFLAIPILSRNKAGYYACVGVAGVFTVVCAWFTYLSYWDDYKNPEHAPGFLASKGEADRLAKRAVELTFAPAGIPKTGALTLLKDDPYVQGPKLFAQHCASCHNFDSKEEVLTNSDYTPIICEDPTAPNLFGAQSADWIRGFTSEETLRDADFFGNTDFVKKDTSRMLNLMSKFKSGETLPDGSVLLTGGLIVDLISPDGSPAFDIMESVFEDFVAEEENVEILTTLIDEDGEADEETLADAQKQYVAKLSEILVSKVDSDEFWAEKEISLPTAVRRALAGVLKDTLFDDAYRELLFDSENVQLIADEDPQTFLTDAYLAQLNGNGEPIAPEDLTYYNRLHQGILDACAAMADVLAEEAKLDAPRPFVEGKYLGLAENAIPDMQYLTCTGCHAFYGVEHASACDLRAYMSRDWIAGFIADPTQKRFYGDSNERMPAYCPTEGDKLMTEKEVELLADWLAGKWYRAPEVANDTRIGANGAAKEASKVAAEAKAALDAEKAAAKAELDAKIAEEAAAKAAEDAEKAKAAEERAKNAEADKAKKAADEKKALQDAVAKAKADAAQAVADAKAAAAKEVADVKAAAAKEIADAKAAATKEADARVSTADQTAAQAVKNAEVERDSARAAAEKATQERDAAQTNAAETNAALEKALAAKNAADKAVVDAQNAA